MTLFKWDPPVRQIFAGNLLLILCCGFYLAWWLLAFRPAGAVKGFRTAWLLLPAFGCGLAAVVLLLRGIGAARPAAPLFPQSLLLWGGAAAYLLLLALTRLLLHRPVTTELFLIVGWAVLSLSEVNALYGMGPLPRGPALAFAAGILAAALISLICYALYYRLGSVAGYLDGMIPLILAALIMAALSIALLRRGA